MVAMVERLDASSFFFHPQLIVSMFSALVLKVCRNRFSCHGGSVAELSPSKLSNFGHSVTIFNEAKFQGFRVSRFEAMPHGAQTLKL
jgi:hypothetical protein